MSRPPFRLAILASGNGTNAEVIMKHFEGRRDIRVALLLSNNPNAYALERAKKFDVPTHAFNREQLQTGEVARWLSEAGITHIVLAGFLWLVPSSLLKQYPGRFINIHPALLPRHGGKGMYGDKVHEAVKASGDKQTGITIHLVNEHFDEGRTIFQASCAVTADDSPDSIAQKVHALEYQHYAPVIEEWILSTADKT